MYKGVIFDFNGTLFFDNDKHVKAWSKISEMIRGQATTLDEIHKLNGIPNNVIIEYFFGHPCSKETLEKYSLLKEEYYRQYCREDVPSFHLVDGVESYFQYLVEHKIPFTIASASIKENIDFFVESFGLDQWMDPSLIVYDDGSYVNKIAMFEEAAKRLNVSCEECIIIEDSLSGIKSAYSCGCQNIIVVNSANKKEEYKLLPGVIKVIEDFMEI